MLAHIRGAYPTLCRNWFDEIEFVGVDGGSMVLRAHSPVHRDYLRRHCLDQFNDALRTVTGRLLAIRFIGPGESDRAESRPGRVADEAEGLLGSPAVGSGVRPLAVAPDEGVRAGLGEAASESGDVVDRVARIDEPLVVRHPGTRGPSRAHYASEAEPLGPGSLVINPDYDFEHFVVGTSNRLAHAACQAVASDPGYAYNPLFIHGKVGLGKTHLLQAVCLEIKRTRPDAAIHYLSCEAFITDFVERVRAGAMAEFRHRFRNVDVLVIDDIHFLAKREGTQEEFFHTFNTLYQAHRQIVLSSDAEPDEIPDLEDRLVSRFKWGMVAEVDSPTFETRVAILKSKSEIRGLSLPDEVAVHIAGVVKGNIRELEGAITKLQLRSMVDERPIDLAMAREAVGVGMGGAGPSGAGPSGTELTVQAIIDVVTEYYSVRRQDLESKKRQRSIALPRQVCMYLARQHTRHSLQEIGRHFGDRDHTTVMHAIKTVDERRERDRAFGSSIQVLEQRLVQTRR